MAEAPTVHVAGGAATIRFQPQHYSSEALSKAAHERTGTCFVHMQTEDAGTVAITLKPRQSLVNIETEALQLANDALDHQLRAQISEQTEPIRRLIIAQAFSKANLFAPELDHATLEQDPLRLRKQDGA